MLAIVVPVLLVACGDTATTAADPPAIVLDADEELIAGEVITELTVTPGAPAPLLVELPEVSCAEGTLHVTWAVVSPAGGEVALRGTREDGTFELGAGTTGQVSAGVCTAVEFVAPAGSEVTVRVRYAISRSTGGG